MKDKDDALKKSLESKKQALKEIEKAKKIKPSKKSLSKAKSKLKKIGKGKK